MVIRNTPKDIENYLSLQPPVSTKMQCLGSIPNYMDNKFLYFKKTKKNINIYKKIIGGINFD